MGRIGGATGFTRECPDSAEEAQQAIQPVLEEAFQVPEDAPFGCCFSIGFGDRMRPCCLQTLPSVQLAFCHVGNRIGGATGFTEGSCPTTVEEAYESLQHSEPSGGNNPATTLLKVAGQHEEPSSALPLALVACVSFAAGSFISVVVMMYRWQNR